MSTQTVLKVITMFVIFLLLQLFVFRGIIIQHYAFCYMYIACILLLPSEVSTTWVILISFLLGLLIDIFYDSAGVHASASVLIGFLRGSVIRFLFPSKGIEADITLTASGMGIERFVRYIFTMTLIHHTMLFFVEAFTLQFVIITVLKIISSVLLTTLVIVLLHLLLRPLQYK